MDDGRRHPINLRNENQEEPHHFKNKINYTHQISIRNQEIESQNRKTQEPNQSTLKHSPND